MQIHQPAIEKRLARLSVTQVGARGLAVAASALMALVLVSAPKGLRYFKLRPCR